MEVDFNNTIHTIRTKKKLLQADAQIEYLRRLVQLCINPDKTVWAPLYNTISTNRVLLAFMRSNFKALDEVVHLLMIKRQFAANDLNEDVRLSHDEGDILVEKFHRNGTWC